TLRRGGGCQASRRQALARCRGPLLLAYRSFLFGNCDFAFALSRTRSGSRDLYLVRTSFLDDPATAECGGERFELGTERTERPAGTAARERRGHGVAARTAQRRAGGPAGAGVADRVLGDAALLVQHHEMLGQQRHALSGAHARPRRVVRPSTRT